MRILKPIGLLSAVIAALWCSTSNGQILPDGASVERLATGYNFTEGPAYDGNGSLYFSNIFFSATPSQIIRYDESSGSTEVIDSNSGMANGLFFDGDGQLISMDMGPARVSRRASDDFSVVDEVWASEWNSVQ